ncbi:protein phosphatase 1 regulatory subunit 12A-like [Rhagoletis pomonella]|uniref:protein phosphatase 1 regulatory subunit 12A-like n=1 Tax=Rhagoletis pomonella TaxID=28610 RepID=UPI0017845D48|nr:protein phosphatase 1 regulatory subunit 12A-like [Rhagoletis pomonella]
MTSLDVRNNSAVMKRAEQLKRWEESDTNRQPPTPRPERGRKIKFSSGCVFLAACMSGDKEEVLKLLENGADINTANVDGLTALHQEANAAASGNATTTTTILATAITTKKYREK